jgi:tRNA pseudouridine55 synthase
MDGLLLIDKPAGWTSHDAVGFIRRAIGEKRVGHTGTLDPAATGLLLILVGKATRLAVYFDGDEKEYRAVMKLGAETDTQDAEGEVIRECPVPALDADMIEAAFEGFRGNISQIPPMYSAIKQGGQPLYKSARAGVEVERAAREVTIGRLQLEGFAEDEIAFSVRCSKGTYIRTLARDIGEALGCCAHLKSLSRTVVGGYRLEDSAGIADKPAGQLLRDRIIPFSDMLRDMPAVVLDEAAARGVKDGRQPGREQMDDVPAVKPNEAVRLVSGSGELLAVAEAGPDPGGPVPFRLKVVLV